MGMKSDLHAVGLIARPEQVMMAEWLETDVESGQVSLIEAPPASGKTLVILRHALRLAEKTGERVLVAVPSLSVMRQTLRAGRTLLDSLGIDVSIAAIHGRQEYVSPDAASDWFRQNAPFALSTLLSWIQSQGADGWTRSSLDAALEADGHDVDIPVETSLLERFHAQAYAAYRRQYETTAKVLVCTHVLLARDAATRAGRRHQDDADLPAMVAANERRLRNETSEDRVLPDWRHLIVDEAHLLASGFMMALTSRLSFGRLLDILAERVAAGAAVPLSRLMSLRKSVEVLENGRDAGKGMRGRRLSMDFPHDRALVRYAEQCIPENPATLGIDEREANYLSRFRDAAMQAQRDRMRTTSRITWSNVERVLGLSVTPTSFGRQLDFCFRSAKSVALLSATLYAPEDDEPYEHLARQLALPTERISAHPPIASDWQRRNVTLMLPEGEMADDLDPTRRDWTSSLAETIALAGEDSHLGMLVLATSNDTIAKVEALLEDHRDRLIMTDERGVGPAAERFVRASRSGMRPIWLATGPAWTGLDLPGDVLDCLFVTRMPYGLANPIMHEHFMGSVKTKVGFRDAETDMLKMLRQGIGRLVRERESTHDRSLWVMDGRIDGKRAGARARAMLAVYGDPVGIVRET